MQPSRVRSTGIRLASRRHRNIAAVTPGHIAALAPVAWYRRGIGMTAAAWVDQVAGGAANFAQATATNQLTPTAYGSMLADGVDNYMSATFTLGQPFTVYGLVNTVTWTSADRILGRSGAFIRQATSTPQVFFSCGSEIGPISPALNTVNVISVIGNGASSSIQLNNDAPVTGDAGANPFSSPFLASTNTPSNFGNTDNYEWIFFSGAHSAATRSIVIRYLATVGGFGI